MPNNIKKICWKRYTQFITNKNELFKIINAIIDLNIAQDKEVKEYLTKQVGKVLKDILDNPTLALGGKGFARTKKELTNYLIYGTEFK